MTGRATSVPAPGEPSPPRLIAAHIAVALANHLEEHRKKHLRDGGQPPPPEIEVLRDLFAAWARDTGPRTTTTPEAHEPAVPRELFTTREVAAAWAVDERTIKRLVEKGELRSVLVASSRRVRRQDLDAYLETHSRDHKGPRGTTHDGGRAVADDAATGRNPR